MSREQLIHIFDESACLTKRQMKDYVCGIMADEEAHAAEVHLNSCPFCGEATEGMLAYKKEDVENVFTVLNSDFLQEHYSHTNPHIHLNSITHAHSNAHRHIKSKKKALPVSVHIAIAAVLLLVLGLIWYFKQGNQLQMNKAIAGLTFSDKTNAATPTQESPQQQPVQDASAQVQNVRSQPVKETIAETKTPPSDNSNNDIKPVIYAAEADTKKQESTGMQPANTSSENMNVAAAPKVIADNSVNEERTNRKAAFVEVSSTVTADGAAEAVKKEDKKTFVPDKLEIGDELYKEKKFDKALAAYNQAMKDENPEKRAEATLKTAQCYIDLGKSDKAKTILERLASEDGTQKKAAQKLLNKTK